jgi:predicted O-methyltransferase YrrM
VENKSLMLPEEIEAILEIIPAHSIVLEIGTFHGVTVAQWAAARPDSIFFSIDPLHWKRAGLKWYENRLPNMRLLTGTVDDLLLLRVAPTFDIIIVDGDHSYCSCYRDLEVSLLVMKPGSTIAVHDFAKATLRRTAARAVIRAVKDFCKSHNYEVARVIGTTAFLEAQ